MWLQSRIHPIVWSVSYSVVPKFTSRGVEHRIRNLSQDIPRMCRDRASKLRFFKFFASNENERCLVHRPSIVLRPRLLPFNIRYKQCEYKHWVLSFIKHIFSSGSYLKVIVIYHCLSFMDFLICKIDAPLL